jgi:hypothetical protein
MLLLAGMFFPRQAMSLPMLEVDDTGVIGINGLKVAYRTYDVRWPAGSFDDVYKGTTPTFWDDSTRALLAAKAINATLTNFSVTLSQIGGGLDNITDNDPYSNIAIPIRPNSPRYYLTASVSSWGNFWPYGSEPRWEAFFQNYYDGMEKIPPTAFTLFRQVPEPATILLFGTGVMGIAIIRRKAFTKKNT